MTEEFEVKEPCPVCGHSDLLSLRPCALGRQYASDVFCRGCGCKIGVDKWNVRTVVVSRLSDDAIRSLIIERLADVKDLLLSPRAVEIVNWVKGSEVTSSDLAKKYSISVANASSQLNRLHMKGYISRVEASDPTGGSVYIYKAISTIYSEDE